MRSVKETGLGPLSPPLHHPPRGGKIRPTSAPGGERGELALPLLCSFYITSMVRKGSRKEAALEAQGKKRRGKKKLRGSLLLSFFFSFENVSRSRGEKPWRHLPRGKRGKKGKGGRERSILIVQPSLLDHSKKREVGKKATTADETGKRGKKKRGKDRHVLVLLPFSHRA